MLSVVVPSLLPIVFSTVTGNVAVVLPVLCRIMGHM
jgi:hypothetical protein